MEILERIYNKLVSNEKEIKRLKDSIANKNSEDLISLKELATLLGVSEKTIKNALPKFPVGTYMTLSVNDSRIGKPVFFKSKLNQLSTIHFSTSNN